MDNQQISGCIPQADDADMAVIRVKNQVAGLCFSPTDLFAVAVLCGGTAAVTQYVFATGSIVKYLSHVTHITCHMSQGTVPCVIG